MERNISEVPELARIKFLFDITIAIAIKMQVAIHDQAPPRTFISSADIIAIYSLYDFSLS